MLGGGRGGAGGARGKIRPPRRMIKPMNASTGDGSDIEESWKTLRSAMEAIHDNKSSKLAFEQLYRASYKIVLNKKGEQLYDRVCEFEATHCNQNIVPQISSSVTTSLVSMALGQLGASSNERRQMGEAFLRTLQTSWAHHNTCVNMVADILMYLDRGYTQDTRRPAIYTACIGLYRDRILRQALNGSADLTILDIVNSVVLDMVNMERDGEVVDHYIIKSTIRMLDSLYEDDNEIENQKLYNTVFERAFLEAMRDYYKAECQKLLRDADAGSWLRHTNQRLAEEHYRCETTVMECTRSQSLQIIEQQLIHAPLDDFLALEGSGLKAMLDNDRLEDMTILFSLVSRIDPGKTSIKTIMAARIVELGVEIQNNLKNTDFSVPTTTNAGQGEEPAAEGAEKAKSAAPLNASAQQTAAAIKWVDDVLKLKDKFDNILATCFKNDLILQAAISKSFSDFINLFDRASEYVSLYIDDNLRKGIRGKTENEIEQVLDKAIVLIRYLRDRDMFERYYQKHLARRLLLGKSESHDAEKSMISRMKQDLGNQFTSKFEGMFKDMQLSADLTTNYRDHVRESASDKDSTPELAISVLTSNSWPPDVMGRSDHFSNSAECIYPEQIRKMQESLTAFYLTNRTGRKLNWVGTAGNADVKCIFPAIPNGKGPLARERKYEINVSTYGMIVLMLFNDLGDQALSFKDIQAETNIAPTDLMKTLTSLSVAPKARVLLKEPQTRRIGPEDTFKFNNGFVSKTYRIKAPIVNQTSKVEADDERKQTEEKNLQSRSHIIDAAIVRTMKQRKELKHSQLISEVVTQLVGRFTPEVSLVKKRIEDLIVREYLERVEDVDTPTYRYLA